MTQFGRKQIKPKQNVLGDIYGTSEVFLRKRQLQIWRAKSEVNIYLEKLEVPKRISIQASGDIKAIYFNVDVHLYGE